jgi:tetratricopeptide (TPR) repeat protein/predicted Ser/Thr protein kinase
MIGRQMSRYRVLSPIGQGGMGEVYLAEDLSLSRKAALKFLPASHTGDDSARERLLREAQSAASLDHPFICKVYEVGTGDDQPFIAMEYIEGTTLKERLEAGPLPLEEAVRLAAEIAEAVDFAHARRIVHRDLKPANIMLTPDGHVKVMDFGVAKRLTSDEAELTTVMGGMTATGEIVGTPAYMSPEQLRGEPVDARSDVFAFGLLLYEMLTGKHPYRKPTVIETASAILNEPQPVLTDRLSAAPALLEHIVARCLTKNPAKRYQSLADVRTELDAVARGAAEAPRQRPRARRSAAAAAALVIALGGLAFAVWKWSDSLPFTQNALAFQERDWIVLADFENLTNEPVFDRSLKIAMEVGLAQSQFVNVFPAARVNEALQRMQKKAERVDAALASEIAQREGVRGVLACSIAKVGSQYLITAQLIDPASQNQALTDSERANGQEQVLAALDKLATRLRRRLGESLNALSSTSVPMPQATTPSLEALKLYTDSFRASRRGDGTQLLQQAIKLDDGFALAHAELGHRYYLTGARVQRPVGEEHFLKSLSLADRLTPREQLWITALAEDSRGNRERAVDAYRNYLERYQDDGRAWFRLGWTLMAGLGQYKPAEEAFRRVIALNPRDSSAYVNLASTLSGQQQYAAAREAYQRSFDITPTMLTETFVNHEYGFTLVRAGDLEGAADAFRKMKAVTEPRDRKPRGLRSLALLEMYRGRYASAIEELRQAILLHTTYGFATSEFRDRMFLARALEAKGLHAQSQTELAAVRVLTARQTFGPEWLTALGRFEARSNRAGDARKTLAQVEKVAGNTLTETSINRNIQQDQQQLLELKGEIARAEGRFDEAVTLLQSVAGNRAADFIYGLASALQGAGRLDDAAREYERLLARQPLGLEAQEDWLAAHVRLGEVYERLNRPADARTQYERLLALWKDGDPDLKLRAQATAGLGRLTARPQ